MTDVLGVKPSSNRASIPDNQVIDTLACDTVMGAMQPYLRILFIMVMSFIVVILGTMAVVEASVPLVEQDAIWLLLFALMVVATIIAARLFKR